MLILSICLSLSLLLCVFLSHSPSPTSSHFLCIPTHLCIGWRGIFDSCAVFSSRGITVAFQKELMSRFVFWKASQSFVRSMTYFAYIISSQNRWVFLFFFFSFFVFDGLIHWSKLSSIKLIHLPPFHIIACLGVLHFDWPYC